MWWLNRMWIVSAVVLSSLATAQGQKSTMTCAQWGGWPGISSQVTINVADWHVYQDNNSVETAKQSVFGIVMKQCPQASFIHLELVQQNLGPHKTFLSFRWERQSGRWVNGNSYVGYLVEQEQAKTAADAQEENRKHDAEARRVARLTFQNSILAKFKVEQWATLDELAANVFIHRGKVIATHVRFQQMLSPSEAMFAYGSPQGIIATSVPSSEFIKPSEELIVAIRIEGLKPFKFLGTDLNVPFGNYVGSYRCQQPSCADFFN